MSIQIPDLELLWPQVRMLEHAIVLHQQIQKWSDVNRQMGRNPQEFWEPELPHPVGHNEDAPSPVVMDLSQKLWYKWDGREGIPEVLHPGVTEGHYPSSLSPESLWNSTGEISCSLAKQRAPGKVFPIGWRCHWEQNCDSPIHVLLKTSAETAREFCVPGRYISDRVMWYPIHQFQRSIISTHMGRDLVPPACLCRIQLSYCPTLLGYDRIGWVGRMHCRPNGPPLILVNWCASWPLEGSK